MKNAILGVLIVLFFSNVTFARSIDFHLCQGEVQSFAFFGQKATCSKMIAAKKQKPLSCCDSSKKMNGLHFKQKSCCDNLLFLNDTDLDKSSGDLQVSSLFVVDFIANFESVISHFSSNQDSSLNEEIPPPPILIAEHTQEKLQVFRI